MQGFSSPFEFRFLNMSPTASWVDGGHPCVLFCARSLVYFMGRPAARGARPWRGRSVHEEIEHGRGRRGSGGGRGAGRTPSDFVKRPRRPAAMSTRSWLIMPMTRWCCRMAAPCKAGGLRKLFVGMFGGGRAPGTGAPRVSAAPGAGGPPSGGVGGGMKVTGVWEEGNVGFMTWKQARCVPRNSSSATTRSRCKRSSWSAVAVRRPVWHHPRVQRAAKLGGGHRARAVICGSVDAAAQRRRLSPIASDGTGNRPDAGSSARDDSCRSHPCCIPTSQGPAKAPSCDSVLTAPIGATDRAAGERPPCQSRASTGGPTARRS